jgi:hypothetical protein
VAVTNSKQLMIIKNKALFGLIIPAGISLIAVRGFKASNFLSINRLNAMAELRAVTMQTNTNNNRFNEKEWPSDNAKVKPIKANGKANIV